MDRNIVDQRARGVHRRGHVAVVRVEQGAADHEAADPGELERGLPARAAFPPERLPLSRN